MVMEEVYRERYHQKLVRGDDDLEWEKRRYEWITEMIEAYEAKYGKEKERPVREKNSGRMVV